VFLCSPLACKVSLVDTFPQLVELKNGETFNGHLVNCDNFMNITLREVYQTSADGDRFWKVKECYIRGSTVCWRFPPHSVRWTPSDCFTLFVR
jgi:small nuclear ribonucleoprotein (snRNP)-like protein